MTRLDDSVKSSLARAYADQRDTANTLRGQLHRMDVFYENVRSLVESDLDDGLVRRSIAVLLREVNE